MWVGFGRKGGRENRSAPRGAFSSMPDARRFGHADVHRRQDFVPFFQGSEGGKGARRSSASKKRTLTCGVPWPPGGFGRRIWLRSFVREPGAAGLRGTNRVRAHASSGEERLRRRRTIDAPRRGACGARTSGTRPAHASGGGPREAEEPASTARQDEPDEDLTKACGTLKTAPKPLKHYST